MLVRASKLVGRKRPWWVFALCVCASWRGAAKGQQSVAPGDQLANLQPVQAAQAFLRRGQPVGIILDAEDWNTSEALVPGIVASPDADASTAVEIFSKSNPRYELKSTERSGRKVLRLGAKGTARCADYLRLSIAPIEREATPIHLLNIILRQQVPSIPDAEPTLMGAAPADEIGYRQTVKYVFAGGTLEEALDQLVLSAKGIGWVLKEVPPSITFTPLSLCSVELFTGGSSATGQVLGPPLR
jgi:hypothetical protein